MSQQLQTIVSKLLVDDEILTTLLQTNYFSWQYKLLLSIATFSGCWSIRDILLFLLNNTPIDSVYIYAAIIRHSVPLPATFHMVSEMDLEKLVKFSSLSEGDFITDIITYLHRDSSLSDDARGTVFRRLWQLVEFVDPASLKKIIDYKPVREHNLELNIRIDLNPIYSLFSNCVASMPKRGVPIVTELFDDVALLE